MRNLWTSRDPASCGRLARIRRGRSSPWPAMTRAEHLDCTQSDHQLLAPDAAEVLRHTHQPDQCARDAAAALVRRRFAAHRQGDLSPPSADLDALAVALAIH
jgi:hypothetical protein